MQEVIYTKEYRIALRFKKRWVLKDKKVYDVIVRQEGKRWDDPSYGNGGGDFIHFKEDKVVYSFDSYKEAEDYKTELERQWKN